MSDELNHSSLVFGARLSGATIRVFKHNDMNDLEEVLREAISQGQPRTHRPWLKIIVIVEGLYSMEGNIASLPEILLLKKKYRFYLFLDEAHSIGAIGPNGRGVCDWFGVSPSNVDILMGTFTKSFGASGGYIAGSKSLITSLRSNGHSSIYAEAICPAVCRQIIESMKIIMGEHAVCRDGAQRLARIRENSIYFHTQLKKLGFVVVGQIGSPVIPLMLFQPTKMSAFSRECIKRYLAIVVVGYPATPINLARVRFCMSANQTKEDLDYALDIISQVGDLLQLKLAKPSMLRSFIPF